MSHYNDDPYVSRKVAVTIMLSEDEHAALMAQNLALHGRTERQLGGHIRRMVMLGMKVKRRVEMSPADPVSSLFPVRYGRGQEGQPRGMV